MPQVEGEQYNHIKGLAGGGQDLLPWKVFGVEQRPTGHLSGVPMSHGDTCCRPIKAESRNATGRGEW